MTSRPLGEGYQGFCDDITKALVLKSMTMGEGVSKNYQKIVRRHLWTTPSQISCHMIYHDSKNIFKLTDFHSLFEVPIRNQVTS